MTETTRAGLEEMLTAENRRHSVKAVERRAYTFTVTIGNATSRATLRQRAKRLGNEKRGGRDALVQALAESLNNLHQGRYRRLPDTTKNPVVSRELTIKHNEDTFSFPINNTDVRRMLDDVAAETGEDRAAAIATLVQVELASHNTFVKPSERETTN